MLSVEALERVLRERVSLNRQILKNPYWFLPVDDVGHEDFMPVGRSVVSSILCGKHVSFSVCFNVEGHKDKSFHGVDVTGKIIVKHNHLWCKNSSCPKCFIRGWSVRQARSVGARLEEGVKRGFGKIEHVVVSVPVKERGLSESVFRKKSRDALVDRGVIGGCMKFHGYRIDKKRKVLVWSPHYHVLGFIGNGGFDRCRECVHKREDCYVCDGFKGKESRGFKKDGYLVSVKGERKTIIGTAWYQLNHATVRVGIKRFHTVTWFGCCANRKYKSAILLSEVTCPVCSEDMVRSAHVGGCKIVTNIGDVGYEACFAYDAFDEDGNPTFIGVIGSRGG